MVDVMDKHMWRVIVVESRDERPVQDIFYFWTGEEAEFFYTKTNDEAFNDPSAYRYALRPVQVK